MTTMRYPVMTLRRADLVAGACAEWIGIYDEVCRLRGDDHAPWVRRGGVSRRDHSRLRVELTPLAQAWLEMARRAGMAPRARTDGACGALTGPTSAGPTSAGLPRRGQPQRGQPQRLSRVSRANPQRGPTSSGPTSSGPTSTGPALYRRRDHRWLDAARWANRAGGGQMGGDVLDVEASVDDASWDRRMADTPAARPRGVARARSRPGPDGYRAPSATASGAVEVVTLWTVTQGMGSGTSW